MDKAIKILYVEDVPNDAIKNKTVSTYRSHIMGKMQLSKNAELTRYCIENNLL